MYIKNKNKYQKHKFKSKFEFQFFTPTPSEGGTKKRNFLKVVIEPKFLNIVYRTYKKDYIQNLRPVSKKLSEL